MKVSATCPALGSSPRERGAREVDPRAGRDNGLIPARAGSTTPKCWTASMTPAHPRASGELILEQEVTIPNLGSSPRERGAHLLDRGGDALRRLIPARAASTERACVPSGCGRAHPRASGEHRVSDIPTDIGWGSSPRERGARAARGRAGAPGLIPARAGSTASPAWTRRTRPAHPRASGEHAGVAYDPAQGGGSSPRERGAPPFAVVVPTLHGLIPAGAGSTVPRAPSGDRAWAHPRASGEHSPIRMPSVAARGSSPRERGSPTGSSGTTPVLRAHPRASGEHESSSDVISQQGGSSPRERGAHPGQGTARLGLGLIPARAGSTTQADRRATEQRAHPRASGEHLRHGGAPSWGVGSSPRERGARRRVRLRQRPGRLIPARAGSTLVDHAHAGSRPAHPRASGEHQPPPEERARIWGSSPRERGAHRAIAGAEVARGLIPARAGSTRQVRSGCGSTRAHPRASGEHQRASNCSAWRRGSSPRERGARRMQVPLDHRAGLIPAGAGSTPRAPAAPPV